MHRSCMNFFDRPFRDFESRLAYAFARGRHGRHGFGRFAGGFADERGSDGHGFRSGRKLSSADLQLVILALIEEKPRHGYEIIKALDDLSRGFYVPSPGIIYPSLTYLEEMGYAAIEAEGSRKLYRLTTEGRAHLDAHRETADATLSQIERVGNKMERLREAVSEEHRGHRGGHKRHRDRSDDDTTLGRSRAALKSALFDARGAAAEDEKLIADILERAAAEIRAIQSRRKV